MKIDTATNIQKEYEPLTRKQIQDYMKAYCIKNPERTITQICEMALAWADFIAPAYYDIHGNRRPHA